MSHFGLDARKAETDPQWLSVGRSVGELVNDWAGRTDIVAHVGERAGAEAGAPAAFNPASAEVDVNTVIAFGGASPKQVGDLTERKKQFEFPKAAGAIYHEAMHAKHSTFSLPDAQKELGDEAFAALILLEESRIEARGVRENPKNAVFLRACALEIVFADMQTDEVREMSSTKQAAQILALAYARVTAGVLKPKDIKPFIPVVSKLISDETRERFEGIWTEFQTARPNTAYGLNRMYELAREWVAVTREQAEQNGEGEGEGESTDGSGSGSEFAEALAEALENAEISVTGAVGEQERMEQNEAEVAARAERASENSKHKQSAEKVFARGAGTGPSGFKTESRLIEKRPASAEERISAVHIGRALERAKYRDRVRIETASALPPGRLRTRAAVQGAALKAVGVRTQNEPWNRVQRKHAEDPNLTIGVMVDISGSMGSAMQPLASAAWVLSEATRRVQGKVAMVYYGDDVFPTLKPGQHLSEVNVYSAPDGTERFDLAFQALNGSLGLLDGSGARMLVIVSDGYYTREERQNCRDWLKRCEQAGVAVLWLAAGSYGVNTEREYGDANRAATFVPVGRAVTDVADAIGAAATQALNAASR